MKPILQVALDFVDLDRAIKVAKDTREYADWIEVGTPLIKSEGISALTRIKKLFPDKNVIADMKVVDVGRTEVEMAAKAGADGVVVLGVADNATIKECIKAGNNYGAKIMVDLLGVADIYGRTAELIGLGAEYVIVHIGIDEQMKGVDPIRELGKLKGVEAVVGIAGGINSENCADALENGASVIIVGGAITKAKNPKRAAKIIREAIDKRKKVRTHLFKRSADVRKTAEKVSSANISDAMHRRGEIRNVRPIAPNIKFAGEAITVRTLPGDWAKPVESIDAAKKGDVIVIDAGGVGPAVWGELATLSCIKKGINGVVIHGAVRDTGEIKKFGFPVFATLVTPTAGEPKGFGEINIPLTIGGTKIEPGDWIVGDEDGVVVIPKADAAEIANRAQDVLEKENRIRAEIEHGGTLGKITHLKEWEKVNTRRKSKKSCCCAEF